MDVILSVFNILTTKYHRFLSPLTSHVLILSPQVLGWEAISGITHYWVVGYPNLEPSYQMIKQRVMGVGRW